MGRWCLLLLVLAAAHAAQLPPSSEPPSAPTSTVEPSPTSTWPAALPPLDSVSIDCSPDNMQLTITLAQQEQGELDNYVYDKSQGLFNGLVYPAGLGTNSSCLREYRSAEGDLQYSLPLTACNTMSVDNEDGTVEFFNNIVVQPHLHLVTGQGRGYHVRCRYRRRDLAHYHRHYVRADRLTAGGGTEDQEIDNDDDADSLPACTMKIFKGDPDKKQVAANVKIGDPLTLIVSLEKQSRYALLVSECRVKDGLGMGEQNLIADDGCSLDGEIMGMFTYSEDRREARVSFPAHRFPYTASVYYTCEVKLCDLSLGTDCDRREARVAFPAHRFPYTASVYYTCEVKLCDLSLGTDCEPCSHRARTRRQADEGSPATVELSSGLYVDETDTQTDADVTKEKNEDEICISQRNFAIGICVAGVILMLAVIAAIAIILARRRSPKTHSRTGSSLYSGPYTNTGYSHTS